MTSQIVIGWTEEAQEIIKMGRVDLGESHTFKTVIKPFAAIWLNKGTEKDVIKAKEYAAREGKQVFSYQNEKDPLARAKKDLIK